MTHRFFIALLFNLCTVFVSLADTSISQDRLRNDFETVYNTWRQYMVRQDFEGWQRTTARFRQVSVRNLAVSEKQPWPASLFNKNIAPPSLMTLRYVGSVVKGPTAAVTYFGKVDMGFGGSPTNNAYVILFARENGQWKYDTARFFNLSRIPDVRNRLSRGDATILQEQDGFQPTGTIPPVPPLCPKPQYIAKIFVDCPGRAVQARVNNISAHSFENTRWAEVISGGLRQGLNTINLTVTPLSGFEQGPLTVSLYIMPETEGNLPGLAYTCSVKANESPRQGLISFSITDETIRQMNPKYRKGQPATKTDLK